MANGKGARFKGPRTHTASHRIPVWSKEAATLQKLQSSRIQLPPMIAPEKPVPTLVPLSVLAYRDERKPRRHPLGYATSNLWR